jgi:hypothetical protein
LNVTVTFLSELYTSERKVLGVTEVDTGSSSHVGAGERSGEKTSGSAGGRLGNTTSSRPSSGKRRGGVDKSRVLSVGVVADYHTGASVKRVVTGKRKDFAVITNVFVDDRVLGLTSISSIAVEERNERRTILQVTANTVVDVAFVDSSLKDVGTVDKRWPTVDEIGVKTVTGSVTIGPYESRIVTAVELEILDVEDEFVKERDEVNRVGSRTVTTINTTRWPGHVRLVIIGIEVDTVPTVGEVDLSSNTLGTVVVGEEAVPLIPVRVTLVLARVVETNVRDGLVGWIRRVKVSSIAFSSEHSKTVGESIDLLVFVAGSRKVVGVHVVDRDHGVRLVRRIVVVELRNPVVGFVLGDDGSRTSTSSHRVVTDRLSKARTTSDRVDVSRDSSRVDDSGSQLRSCKKQRQDLRVQSSSLKNLLLHNEESVGRGQEWQ